MGTATPVDVSLCGVQYASTPASGANAGAEPGSALRTVGSPRNGASAAALANFAPNSPNEANWARSRIRPNVATSQNAVVPPLPITTSYPSGSWKSSARPARRRATWSRTVFCRCEVPRYLVPVRDSASTAAGRTLEGPLPKRPSAGLSWSGIRMVETSATMIKVLPGEVAACGRLAERHPPTRMGCRLTVPARK